MGFQWVQCREIVYLMLGHLVPMRALLLTLMMLCACLFVPGCFGEQKEIICEEEGVTLTQYDVFECEFQIIADSATLNIEMTNTGDSPVHIFTIHSSEYDQWINCKEGVSHEESTHLHDDHFFYFGDLSEMDSMSSSLSGESERTYPDADGFETNYYVLFDHPNSCDDEETSDIVDISFKVSVT